MQEELDNLAVGVATIFLDGLRTLLFTIPMLFLAAGVLLAWGGPILWLYGIGAALMGAIALLYLILAIWRRLRAAFSKPPAPMKPSAERYVQRARARLPAESFVDAKPKARSREIYALLDETLRPTAGKALFSYTDAWMTVTKMFVGGTMSREQMKRIAGEKMARMAISNSPTRGRSNSSRQDGRIIDQGCSVVVTAMRAAASFRR